MSGSDPGHSDDQEGVESPYGQVASCTDQAMESKPGSRATLDEKKENIDGSVHQPEGLVVVRGNTSFIMDKFPGARGGLEGSGNG
ncbi:hypothetical protein MUP59_04550 [Candidatus Bathyarchaeota archaeon]|nr:hypothetical protein [Candidatus Bathyarchaeota archaeon]